MPLATALCDGNIANAYLCCSLVGNAWFEYGHDMHDENLGNRLFRLAWIAVAALIVVSYVNSFSGSFLMDDDGRILSNPEMRDLSSVCLGSTRPVVDLTFWLNMQMGGRAADFHLVNLLLHLTAALLLFGIIRRVCQLSNLTISASYGFAVIGASVWGVHPVQTQAVTYIVQRAESLMGMFAMLSLYALVRSVDSTRHSRLWLVISVLACASGMATKPVMLVVPLVIWITARQFELFKSDYMRRYRLVYFGALFATMLIAAGLSLVPNESSGTTGLADGLLSPWRYLLTQFGVIVHYLRLVFWPRGLCLDYGWPGVGAINEVWWQFLVITVLVIAAIVGCWQRNGIGFGLALFFLLLAPTSSVIPVADAAVEHRLYLPLVGMVVLVGAAFRAFGSRQPGSLYWRIMAACGVAVCLVLAGLTYARNSDYSSRVTMYRDTHEKRPDNFRAGVSLVMALLDAGQYMEGEEVAREVLDRIKRGIDIGGVYAETGAMNAWGFYRVAVNQLGRAILSQGRYSEALGYFDHVIEGWPDHREAWLNKALAHQELGDGKAALIAVDRALAISPDYGNAQLARELILRDME